MNSKNIKTVLKTQAKVISYVVICLVVIVIGISYSLYSEVEHNTKNQIVKAGTLEFKYNQGTTITSSANEICFNQTTYEEAKTHTECEYSVEITNTGTLPGNYSLTLESTANNNALALNKLKVILKKSGQEVSSTPKALSGTTTSLVSNEKIAAGATIKYSVIVYIDDSSVEETDNDKEIALKINGSAEVSADNINPQLPNK